MSKPANKLFDPATTAAGDAAAGAVDGAAAGESGAAERTEFPCSVAQERFWLLDRLDPGSSSYNVAVRWRLEGRIATDLLEKAWFTIIERHEVLRTVFLEVDGVAMQRVMPRARFRLNEIDLSNLSPELQQTEGDRIGVIEARAPFDLAAGPLLRATLLRFSPSVSILLVTTHQIVSDGWSIGVMAREMGVIYDALKNAKALALDPLAIQYADYSMWQLEWFKARGTEAEVAYWTKQLAGIKPFKVLPDHGRPAMPTTNGAIASRVLPRELTNRAQALSAERGATLFATAFAALCATLARFTNDYEVVVGTQVSDRDQVELEPMVGQFVNSLILRNDLSGNPSFGMIVDRVRDTIAQALEHRHIPIERLLGMVKAERSNANTPPISVNFIYQKTFIQNTAYTDFALIDMPSLPAGAIYDLNFFMVERPDGWRLSCQYNTDQFERSTAERLLGYFETLLRSAVANSAQRLSDLPLSALDDAKALLAKLNDTRVLYPRELTLAQLFEAQVARAPDSIAVLCGEQQLSYGDVNAAANRFSAYLRHEGVSPGSRVGVCLQASAELPIALLGVLKAGATVVPLDPSDPPLRRADVIRASGTTAVIGQRLQREALANVPVNLIDLETGLAHSVDRPWPASVRVPTHAESIAFTFFTSGNSEASRVVNVSHRNLANLIYAMAKHPGVGERDVVVVSSPMTAARASLEMFLPLLTGARLVVPLEKDSATGRALLHLLQRTRATVMYGAPHVWSGLLGADWMGYPALKMLCSARELNTKLVDRLASMGGELWALYGHPEAGIWSSIRLIKGHGIPGDVGQPISNTTLRVLTPALKIAPIGAVGELYIGGDGLSDGALAAAVNFEPDVKLYPTGDFGRLQATGQIEYLGRKDDRFTVRGRSVDPAEIEQALKRHPDLADAAVVHVSDDAGEVTIAAFIVTRELVHATGAALTGEVRRYLAELLPDYLLPSTIEQSAALPRLVGGRLDRRALELQTSRAGRGDVQQKPSGPVEVRLAAIWSSMLGIEAVNGQDNFFELGGHSLLAARMLTHVEREFGRRIKLATLFLAPTLQEFAKVLMQTDLREFEFRQLVKIQPHGSKRPLIAINNTGTYYSLAKALGSDQPVYSLQLFDPSVKDAALPESLEEIARGYVDLIRRVQPQGPYDLMGWCVAGALAFEIARQLNENHQDVSHLFLIDSWVPGYFKRLPKLQGFLGGYSLRAQLILADLKRVFISDKSFGAFVMNRKIIQKIKRVLFRAIGRKQAAPVEMAPSAETYDQWLLAYLKRVTETYSLKPYRGQVTILRSRSEPTGWFFKKDAGWGEFLSSEVDVRIVDGNHFTMFQEPGSTQMAAHVVSALTKSRDA